jgi:voltage-gated potassium channel
MITGIAVLGMLAGSLSSFFRLNGNGDNGAAADEPAGAVVTATDAIQALATEVSALRYQVAALTERLTGTRPDATPPEPAPGEDAPG